MFVHLGIFCLFGLFYFFSFPVEREARKRPVDGPLSETVMKNTPSTFCWGFSRGRLRASVCSVHRSQIRGKDIYFTEHPESKRQEELRERLEKVCEDLPSLDLCNS